MISRSASATRTAADRGRTGRLIFAGFAKSCLTRPAENVESAPSLAGIAQLVEHNLAKVGVASSNLVSRSRLRTPRLGAGFLLWDTGRAMHGGADFPKTLGSFTQIWLSGRVVMQRPAKPCTSVRFRAQPPYSVPNSSRPGGEIGRRNGLKIRRPLRPCRFESGPGHQRFKEASESVSDGGQQTGEQACDRSW